jgi:hypothetical protein
MKLAAVLALYLFARVSLAQAAPTPNPSLSTADRVAINTLEKAKQDAGKEYTDAQQSEDSIFHEFAAAHPGYHINPKTFAVEADPKTEAPKETKKP